jgi:hypothetical protein
MVLKKKKKKLKENKKIFIFALEKNILSGFLDE